MIGTVKRCSLSSPGHTVHWIQAKLSTREPGLVEDGDIVDIGPEVVAVRVGSDIREYRNHDTARLTQVIRELGASVTVQERYSLLKVPTHTVNHCFSIAKSAGSWVECRTDPIP